MRREIGGGCICTAVCSNNSASRSDSEIQDVILTLSTAWVSWHAGLEAEAQRWWDASDEVLDNYILNGDVMQISKLRRLWLVLQKHLH